MTATLALAVIVGLVLAGAGLGAYIVDVLAHRGDRRASADVLVRIADAVEAIERHTEQAAAAAGDTFTVVEGIERDDLRAVRDAVDRITERIAPA